MTDNPISVAGIEIPSDSPIFLAALGVHVLAGIFCVGAGFVAMLSRKRPGRHPSFGTIYYYCLSVVRLRDHLVSDALGRGLPPVHSRNAFLCDSFNWAHGSPATLAQPDQTAHKLYGPVLHPAAYRLLCR